MTSSASRHLNLDIETYSTEDLPSVGAYKYAAAPGFRVLLCGYAWDGGPVHLCDLTRDALPDDVAQALTDPSVAKHAFNAAFERVCLSAHLGLPEGTYLDPRQWRCTMVAAAYWGASGSLKQVGGFLGVEMRKDAAGTRLINKFSKPQARPVPREGEDWERFKAYCIRDVECEMEIASKLPDPLPAQEQLAYVIDQRINDRGVLVDGELARQARAMAAEEGLRAKRELARITGLANPNSPAQLLGWLQGRGCQVGNCGKDALAAEAAREGCDALAREAIGLRLSSVKSSTKKYDVAADAPGSEGRLRGCFQFYGAATGRWAGRLMQLQNLPRGDLSGEALEDARRWAKAGDADALRMLYGSVQDALKSLVRTTLVPAKGKLLAVADYSAVEARVLAWLAGERWALEVFRGDGKVYEATASRMFGVPIEAVGKDLRARGKVATLALGYQGGPRALERMGALAMGIPASELPKLVRMWRNANKRIKALWGEAEAAAYKALSGEGPSRICCNRVTVRREPRIRGLAIELPSGRALHYRNARVRSSDGHLAYECCGKGARPLTVETYGGRIVENITQAVARDLLATSLKGLDGRYPVVAHVHDEVVCEVDADGAEEALAAIEATMCQGASWSEGLPLAADGYVCESYRKE